MLTNKEMRKDELAAAQILFKLLFQHKKRC